MNVFEASNLPYLSDLELMNNFEDADRIRATSPSQAAVGRAIEIMNLIADESDRREFA